MIKFTLVNIFKEYCMLFLGYCFFELICCSLYSFFVAINFKVQKTDISKADYNSDTIGIGMARIEEMLGSVVPFMSGILLIMGVVLIILNANKLINQDYENRESVLNSITIGVVLVFFGFIVSFVLNGSWGIDGTIFTESFAKALGIILPLSFFIMLIPISLLISKFIRSKNMRYVASLYIKESKESKFTHFKFINMNREILYAHSLGKNLMDYFV